MKDSIDGYIWTLLWLTLILIQAHRSARKLTFLCQLSHNVFDQFGWNLAKCWEWLVCWTSCSFYFFSSRFEGENFTLAIWLKKKIIKKNFTSPCIQTYFGPISFTLGMMTGTSELCILTSAWMTLIFIQGHSCMRNKKNKWCKVSQLYEK